MAQEELSPLNGRRRFSFFSGWRSPKGGDEMKTARLSPSLLLVGLGLGLLALWAGAAPAGIAGDVITGGKWHEQSVYWFACAGKREAPDCMRCTGEHIEYCNSYYLGPCSGGPISVVDGSYMGSIPYGYGTDGICEGDWPGCRGAIDGYCP
jgi:hypothetical protein